VACNFTQWFEIFLNRCGLKYSSLACSFRQSLWLEISIAHRTRLCQIYFRDTSYLSFDLHLVSEVTKVFIVGLTTETNSTDLFGRTTVMTEILTPQCWQDFNEVMDAGIKRVLLYGFTGTGKTYTALTHNAPNGALRLICSDEMTKADLEGTWKPKAGEWHYAEGTAVKAWRTGARLVVDEGDKASGDVLGIMLNFLDSVASSSWTNPDTNEVVTPHQDFSAIITSNIEVPEMLPDALRDRFSIRININAPHPNALKMLPENLRVVANAVISAEPERRFSLRAFYDFNQLLESGLKMERACELTFGKTSAEAIIDAIRLGA
jgi:hypothetical protein